MILKKWANYVVCAAFSTIARPFHAPATQDYHEDRLFEVPGMDTHNVCRFRAFGSRTLYQKFCCSIPARGLARTGGLLPYSSARYMSPLGSNKAAVSRVRVNYLDARADCAPSGPQHVYPYPFS